mmetsp:Transcript_9551/g.21647  ORF Transcript_9551/g.21647 Transcript_9551/m.21647 type:complete len:310 (-) Transcript_9551:62-991(-)
MHAHWRSSSLVEANQLPPHAADAENDRELKHAENASDDPPLGQRHVARAVERRARANAVVRQASHVVAHDAEGDRGDERGGAACEGNAQECRVHCADVRGTRREQVVAVEVDERDDEEASLPRKAERLHEADDEVREPRDEAELVEEVGHGNERGEPHERVPRRSLGKALLPREHASDHKDGHSDECGGHAADAKRSAEDPESHRQREAASHNLLLLAHRAHLLELRFRFRRRLRRVFHLRRVEDVEQQRNSDEQDAAGNAGGERPLSPRDGVSRECRGEVHAERVGRHGGDEHAAGDARGVEYCRHEV